MSSTASSAVALRLSSIGLTSTISIEPSAPTPRRARARGALRGRTARPSPVCRRPARPRDRVRRGRARHGRSRLRRRASTTRAPPARSRSCRHRSSCRCARRDRAAAASRSHRANGCRSARHGSDRPPGTSTASLSKLSPPSPSAAASDIPWTLPVGEVSGVFMSACASNQSRPPTPRSREMPPSVPSEIDWSPPRTSGRKPSASAVRTRRAIRPPAALISGRYFAWSSLIDDASRIAVSMLPQSTTSWPISVSRSRRPA